MPGLLPGIHFLAQERRGWPGRSPAMTKFVFSSQDEASSSPAGSGILDDRSKQLPALAVELHHLQLLVDAIIGRRGSADDAGQGQVQLNVFEGGGLLHDVVAGKVVAAALEHLDQELGGGVAVGVEAGILVTY